MNYPFLYIKIRLYWLKKLTIQCLRSPVFQQVPCTMLPNKVPYTIRLFHILYRRAWDWIFPAFIWIRNNWVGTSQSNTHQPIKTSLCETTKDLYRPMHGANWDVEQTTRITKFPHKFPYTMFSFKVLYTLFSTRLPGSTLRLSHRHQIGCSHMSLWRHKAGWHVISNVGKHRLSTPWHNLFDWDKMAEINWDRKDTIHQMIQALLSQQWQMQSFNFTKMTFAF